MKFIIHPKKIYPQLFPDFRHWSEQLFTLAALFVFLVFVIDLFTSVLRRHDPTLLVAVPGFGVILGMLGVVREERAPAAWFALCLNTLFLTLVLAGVMFERSLH